MNPRAIALDGFLSGSTLALVTDGYLAETSAQVTGALDRPMRDVAQILLGIFGVDAPPTQEGIRSVSSTLLRVLGCRSTALIEPFRSAASVLLRILGTGTAVLEKPMSDVAQKLIRSFGMSTSQVERPLTSVASTLLGIFGGAKSPLQSPLQSLGSTALAALGSESMQLQRKASATFDPATLSTTFGATESQTLNCAPPSPVKQEFVGEGNVVASDMQTSIAAKDVTWAPEPGMNAVVGSKTFEVIRVVPIYAGALPALYILILRG